VPSHKFFAIVGGIISREKNPMGIITIVTALFGISFYWFMVICFHLDIFANSFNSAKELHDYHSIPSFYFRQRSPYRRNKDYTKGQRIQYKAQKTHKHIYATRSNFTRALLLALQLATSDFLALIIRVSKL